MKIYFTFMYINVVLCSFLFLGSCSDERLLDNKLRKMNGSWSFHKVNYKADSKLFSENVTDDFKDIEWVFNDNGDVMQIDHLDKSDEEEIMAKRSDAKAKIREASDMLANSDGVLDGEVRDMPPI